MNKFKGGITLNQKLWITISLVVALTILFTFCLTHYFHQKIYVEDVKNSLEKEGLLLADEYKGGAISKELEAQVKWYNRISESEVILVDNPRELSACLPFELNYQPIIGNEERTQLLTGKVVTKLGYEERFNRNIMGVIVPLLDDKRLQGIIYVYLPLATVLEVFRDSSYILIGSGFLFIILTVLLGKQIVSRLTKPLQDMERVAQKMSKGDFSQKVMITTNDEVGFLGRAFNEMSTALDEEDQRRKEFLGNVSHELRTPLSYVQGYSEAILDGLIQSKEETQKYLQLIHREASRMQRLVRDLLDLAQLEGDSYPLKKTPLVLAQFIAESLEKFEPFLKEKGLELKVNLDPEMIVLGDEDRLEQVIHNIMDNAIRYSHQGGSITVELTQKDLTAQLIIADSGIGIPEDFQGRIGERFFRVDKARSRKQGGTGLGLAITQKIVALHQGEMKIKSKEGQGTEVIITLPLMKEEFNNLIL